MATKLFTDYLQEIGRGDLNEQLSRKMRDLVEGVYTTGKKGTLTLKLDIDTKGDHVVVSAAVNAKIPETGVKPSLYFVEEETFNLSRTDPRQMDLADAVKAAESKEKTKHSA